MSEVVTAEQIEAFRTNGFVVVDDLLTDAELDTFEPLVTAAVAYRSAGDERTLEEPSAHRLGRATPRHISIAHTWPAYMRIPRPRNCPVNGAIAAPISESWRAEKCDRPCESDGTSDAVASSARTCVEAASQPRDDGTRPSGQHRDLPRFEGMLNMRRRRIRLLHELFQIGLLESAEYNVQQRWGTERLDRRSRRRQAGSPRDRFRLWAKPSWRAKPNTSANKHAQARNQLEATKRRKPQS